MLQDIRDNSQGTIAKIIVVAVIVSLSIFGVDAIVGGFGGEPSVATVNGEDITEREFQRGVQMRRQQLLQDMDSPDQSLLDEGQINQEVLDSLINQALVYQDARKRGLNLSDTEIDQLITSMPAFQVDGQFNQQRFMGVVRNQGMGIREFREALRHDFLMRQIQSAVSIGAFASPETAKTLLALQQQSREIATLNLDRSLVADDIAISDSEIQSYYTENTGQFIQPESVDVAWIELDRNAMRDEIDVPEEEVRALYDSRVAAMAAQEEREAAHILLEPAGGADGDEVAPERIAEVEAALASGEAFGEVAERLSDDPGSAGSGGDLGYAPRGTYEESFEEALFAIETEGEVVGPVKSSYGVHFIKLMDVRTQAKPEFEEMRDNLRNELASEQANELYIERSDRLADIAFSAFDLEEPAAEVDAEIQKAEGIVREGENPPPFDHGGLVRQLFAEEVLVDGNNTELVEVGDGLAIVARVTEHYPQETLPLEEVEDEIRSTLSRIKVQEALNQLADEWVTALNAGEDPAAIAEKASSDWSASREIQRGAADVPAPVLQTAFSLPHPEGGPVYGKADVSEGVTLIQLNSVSNPTIEEEDPAINAVQSLVARQQSSQAARSYLEMLRDNAEIIRE